MGGLYAARLWWALDYYGHPNCKVLNGGFRKWFEEGRAVSMDSAARRARQVRGARRPRGHLRHAGRRRERDRQQDTVIWDVREAVEYAGTDGPRRIKRHGHIPGARHLEWLDLTVKPPVRSGLLLPADQIAEKLAAIGVTPDKRVITHCQAGIRAAQAVFVLRLMGYPDARNYDASWAEWGNVDDTPITTD